MRATAWTAVAVTSAVVMAAAVDMMAAVGVRGGVRECARVVRMRVGMSMQSVDMRVDVRVGLRVNMPQAPSSSLD